MGYAMETIRALGTCLKSANLKGYRVTFNQAFSFRVFHLFYWQNLICDTLLVSPTSLPLPPFTALVIQPVISDMPSFNWISDLRLVSVYNVTTDDICGYLAKGFPEWPGNLHMQFACPWIGCGARQYLALHPISRRAFIINAEEYYDMRDAIFRDSQEGVIYDHSKNAVTISSLYTYPNYSTMRSLPFSFIHKCAECCLFIDMTILWSRRRRTFDLTMWPHRGEDPDIDVAQIWVFGGKLGKKIRKVARDHEWLWGGPQETRGVRRNGLPRISARPRAI
jgi:hypothetical protein